MSQTVEIPVEMLRESVQIGQDAAALAEKVAADQTAIEAKIPLVVDTLVENGLIDHMDKEATVKLLQDPVKAIDVIERLSKQASRPRSMGMPSKAAVDAGFDPQSPPQAESDRIFAEKLFGGDV